MATGINSDWDEWDEVRLPFTSPCVGTQNFPYEREESLRWKCCLFSGHSGACAPSAESTRLYAIRRFYNPPEPVAGRIPPFTEGTLFPDERFGNA